MKRSIILSTIAAISAALILTGCAQPVSQAATLAPTATAAKAGEPPKAPTAPPTAVEPTKAPALASATPATKSSFPEKGKPITMIVPWAAGGSLDLSARLLASDMEKTLGTSIQVVNKAGASGQVGTTELAKAKPDGYTFGVTAIPSTNTIYLDPERQSVFSRKDLAPIARHSSDPEVIGVSSDSKYQTVKDLIDDAKANPQKIKFGTAGILSVMHLGVLSLQKATGTEFSVVQFDGGAQSTTALVGGHIDAVVDTIGTMAPFIKAGKIRVLGVMDRQPAAMLPEAKTLESQGIKVYTTTSRGYSAPGGTPKEIIDTLSAAIKKAADSEEHRKKLEEISTTVAYLDPAGFAAYWDEVDSQVAPLIDLAKQK